MKTEKIKQLVDKVPNPELVLAMLKANKKLLEELAVLRIMQTITDKVTLSKLISKSCVPAEFINDNEALKAYLAKQIEECRKLYLKRHTFALPSDSIMFYLLSLFSGKPKRPQIDQLVSSVISNKPGKKRINSSLDQVSETQKIGILKDSIKIHATASLADIKMFDDETLAVYIKKTFGPEGLRHFLALIIGLEENVRVGKFEWDVNRHLERLGYKRKSGGSYKSADKQKAIDMVQLLASLILVVKRKDEKNKKDKVIDLERLFTVPGAKINESSGWESVVIRAEDFWYTLPTSNEPRYTKLLKGIVQENHSQHSLSIFLAPLLAVFWRIEGKKKFSVRKLMHWCDLDTDSYLWMQQLKNLEKELGYMQQRKYLGSWNHDGENALPSDCNDPMNVVVTLEPPAWLQKELIKISDKAATFKPLTGVKQLSNDQFKEIYSNSGLKVPDFASQINVSDKMVYRLLNDNQKVSEKLSKRVREEFLSTKSTPTNK
jgi:hypothetical protein